MISLHCHFSKESSGKPDPSPLSSFYSSLFFAFFLAPFLSSCHSGVWLKLVSILGWGESLVVELLWGPRLNPSTAEKDWVTLRSPLESLLCPRTSSNTVCWFASNLVIARNDRWGIRSQEDQSPEPLGYSVASLSPEPHPSLCPGSPPSLICLLWNKRWDGSETLLTHRWTLHKSGGRNNSTMFCNKM